ncbi:hypothetical protein Dsin_031910 [Dipteronia sinensis]|uniref:F-box domain-containing protein n=1 Tax=Dipteronia sinensis TaxID=43782 RepID=A0AAE0DST1_9ROSI|nr:hypothetical protein Dsin_031910 [Dipteronia sinensis]
MKRARDRLSNLPNPIIYNILSLMDTKYAVRTCVLSKKWLFHWRYIHSLNFYTNTFTKVSTFRKFVLHVLRRRRSFGVRRLKFLIGYNYKAKSRNSSVEKKVFDYAASYGGLEELETNFYSKFPESIVQCQSLKTLKLSTYPSNEDLQNSFDLASLTTLQLSGTSFSETQNKSFDIFSTCLNLENLILNNCSSYGKEIFEISAPRLIHLSISGFRLPDSIKTKIVISTPSLVKLNISNLMLQGMNIKEVVVISAPRLKFFNFQVEYRLTLSIEKCSSLEKMNVRVFPPVAWRETYNWEQGYMFDLLCITEGSYRGKSIDILFKFSKGKFKSFHVDSGAETEVVEFIKVNLVNFDKMTKRVGPSQLFGSLFCHRVGSSQLKLGLFGPVSQLAKHQKLSIWNSRAVASGAGRGVPPFYSGRRGGEPSSICSLRHFLHRRTRLYPPSQQIAIRQSELHFLVLILFLLYNQV